MTLQSSGAISLANIASEFGGSTPHSLSEYYSVASGIPSSGTISMSQFYGKSSGPQLQITSYATVYQPATTGKSAGPAYLVFDNAQSAAIVNAALGVSNGAALVISDGGYYYYNTWGQTGMSLNVQSGLSYPTYQAAIQSSYNFAKTGDYIKIYYGSTLKFTSNYKHDINASNEAMHFANNSNGVLGINGNSSTSSWRVEYWY